MFTVQKCPVCEGNTFTPLFSCTDNTVSHETFEIAKCENCTLLITTPRPEDGDLGKYYESQNYISHAEQSKTLFDNIYRVARLFSLNWKLKVLQSNLNPSDEVLRVLDFGCGTGTFLRTCQREGYVVKGVEPSLTARNQAKKLIPDGIFETLTEIHDDFDAITLWHVLEHVPNINDVIHQLKSSLKKNGIMFIAVPNHLSKDAREYHNNWAAYDVPRHLWHFNQKSINILMRKHSLELLKIIPMKLDAYYVSILSETNKTYPSKKITSFVKGILSGFTSNKQAKTTTEYSSLIYVIKKS